jgi:hypothetical protein
MLAIAKADVKTESLPQGVLIREIDVKIRIRALEWRVIVTLDSAEKYEKLVNAVKKMGESKLVQGNALWETELEGLRTRLERVLRTTRSRRGLIDGVGLITQSLFGLATDADVKEVRVKVEENRRMLQEVTHWSSEWTSVVNATFHLARENRRFLRNLTTVFANHLQVSHRLAQLRAAMQDAKQCAEERRRIRDDLEDGLLTETIFPRDYFEQLRTIKKWIAPPEWYYTHVRVRPLRGSNAFEARLPLVNTRRLLSYELQIFPIFSSEHSKAAQL